MDSGTFTDPTLQQVQRFQVGLQQWDAADSFISPMDARETDRRRRENMARQLETEVVKTRENMQAVASLVGEHGDVVDRSATEVSEAADRTADATDELRIAAKEHVRFWPLKASGAIAAVGGTVGVVVGLAPGAAVGAAVGGAVGAVAGTIAKGVAQSQINGSGGCRSTASRRSVPAPAPSHDDPGESRRSSWQEDAEREWGPDHYVPGDLLRTLNNGKTWKGRSGREWGEDSYQIGDIGRTVKRTVLRRHTERPPPTCESQDS
mmetsp:Transcript_17182/g.53900  ORF Transcript_17182/g.53900 Transcript_17182/m.53900 type:complete len:264 (-) Transcript_17182:53-844(-)